MRLAYSAVTALFLIFVSQFAYAAIYTQSFGNANIGSGTSDCPQNGVANSTCTFSLSDSSGNFAGGSTKASVTYSGTLFASGTAVADGPNSGIYASAGSQADLTDYFTIDNPNFSYAVISMSFGGNGAGAITAGNLGNGLTIPYDTSVDCLNTQGPCSITLLSDRSGNAVEFNILAEVNAGGQVLSQGMGTVQSAGFESGSVTLAVYDTNGKPIAYAEGDPNIDLPGSLPISPVPLPTSFLLMLSGIAFASSLALLSQMTKRRWQMIGSQEVLRTKVNAALRFAVGLLIICASAGGIAQSGSPPKIKNGAVCSHGAPNGQNGALSLVAADASCASNACYPGPTGYFDNATPVNVDWYCKAPDRNCAVPGGEGDMKDDSACVGGLGYHCVDPNYHKSRMHLDFLGPQACGGGSPLPNTAGRCAFSHASCDKRDPNGCPSLDTCQ